MKRPIFLIPFALSAASCGERNLMGEELWDDDKLEQAEVGFGWNYNLNRPDALSRYVEIFIQPNGSSVIQIGEYKVDAAPSVIDRYEGQLDAKNATIIKRSLANLRSSGSSIPYATLPGCPMVFPISVEYYVGFSGGEAAAVTVVEHTCHTPETAKAREILIKALGAFPQLDQSRLRAGQEHF